MVLVVFMVVVIAAVQFLEVALDVNVHAVIVVNIAVGVCYCCCVHCCHSRCSC